MAGEIHPEASRFIRDHSRLHDILRPFLAAGFDVTWANVRRYSGGDVDVCFLKASPDLVAAYGFEYEMILGYSRYRRLEPRTLRAIEHVFTDDPAKGRVEPMWYFLVSEDPEVVEWISSYLSEHKESRIVVPFQANVLSAAHSGDVIRTELHRHFLSLDRYKYTLPLKEDTYFFGRTSELGKLLDLVRRSENAGLFGLRKTGKTSVLLKLSRLLETDSAHAVLLFDAQTSDIRKRH